MASVKESADLDNLPDLDTVKRYASRILNELKDQVNGQLDFSSNIKSFGPSQVVFNRVNADIAVTHTLRNVPQGFIIINSLQPIRVYQGTTPWTKDKLYLRSDVVGTVTILVI